MTEAHQDAIQILVFAAGLILLAIFTPFILKAFRKSKSEPGLPTVEPELEQGNTLAEALAKTKDNFWGRIKNVFMGDSVRPLEDIEEVLYTADMGSQTVQSLMNHLDQNLSGADKKSIDTIKKLLKEKILSILQTSNGSMETDNIGITERLKWAKEGPTVLMIVGVNGAGKTTTIGKLSALMANQSKRVLVAAGDTFRAAAQNQLKVWTDRAQVEIFSPAGVTDPSAVAFDAVAKAKAQNYDLVIVDTAGRLHTQANLMEELKKVKRVMGKNNPEAPHNIWIVLDANSGQNALIQAREFHQALGLTGVILTKMDGTAKGGVVIGISNELKIPIKILGIGEKINDLKPFSQKEYIDSII